MSKRIYKSSLLATTIIAGLTVAMPAYAQDTDTTDEGTTAQTGPGVQAQEAVPPAEDEGGEIVITGTLIRNPNLTASSSVADVGQEEISLTQATNAEEIIRDIPGVVPSLGSNVNNGTVGASRVDLRGLGSNRNLVMLDSTRLTPQSFSGAVDLNNIPVALVDRIDVLTGGASTTYGADAVTGVVNFITKKDFAGLDLQLTEGITERGDTNQFRADLVLGANFDDGRGNAVLGLSYMEADELFFAGRDVGQCTISSFSGICGGDSPTATPTSFALGVVTGTSITRNSLIGFPAGNLQIGPTNNTLIPQYSVFNFNPYNIYSTPFKRNNVYAAAHYDVSDTISVYGRGLFSKNVISGIIAPSGVFGETLTVPGSNPFLTTQLRDQLCTSAGIALGTACTSATAIPLGAVYRRTTEVGPRISEYTTNYFDMKAGFSWDITQNINLDIYGAYGESENREVRQNYVAKSRLQQALNTNNTTTCTIPVLQPAAPAGCVPLNLFGPPGSITPAMAGFIGGITASIVNKASLAQVHGVVSGDFGFAMPWSAEPVAFAVGAEHRDYTARREPDNLTQQPGELGGAGGAILPINGGYTAEDFFGELIVPIASDRPFMQELTLEAGIRYSKYKVDTPSDPKFNATTYKIGGTWQPIEALKFRANWQKAVRAPNIGELFAPVVTGLTNLADDPCAGTTNPAAVTSSLPLNTALATNPNLVAVCIAQGASAGLIGSIERPAAGQSNRTGGGNPLLQPETAKTLTLGVVISPKSLLPGFNATLDYYRIHVTDAITGPLPGDVIAACFGPGATVGSTVTVTAASATSAACTSIRRSPTSGRLSGSPANTPGLPIPLTNAGDLFTDGVDLTMNYRRDVGFADLILNFAGNWTRHAEFDANPEDSNSPPNCPGLYSANCGIALGQLQPEFSWNQRTTLSFKHVDVSLLWRHLTKFKYEFAGTAGALYQGTITGAGPLVGTSVNFNKIPAYDYFDLSSRFNVTDHFELTLSAFNIFDKKPPILGANAGTTTANSGNTFPSTYDVLGRRYSATARIKF
jgi:outer membrane receptor protein involved in Fe transport